MLFLIICLSLYLYEAEKACLSVRQKKTFRQTERNWKSVTLKFIETQPDYIHNYVISAKIHNGNCIIPLHVFTKQQYPQNVHFSSRGSACK